uniref:DUF6465 family protein n=1 Tax=Eubacterium sp. TaxID=142586 RepID=UPI003FED3FF5
MATKKTQTAKTTVKEEAKKATQTVKETAEKVEKSAKQVAKKAETATKKAVDKAEKATKETAKKTESAVKEAAKKAEPAKKAPKKTKKAAVEEVFFEFAGKKIKPADMAEAAKQDYIAAGHKASSIKALRVYVKAEDNAAYYVINDEVTGKVSL